MNRIQLLDNLTINKIAAGEVVERPSSVVKELVENSIDAGATSVTVEVKDGGTTFIKITDNGCGIEKEQVRTAFLRHATSKIQFVEDLEKEKLPEDVEKSKTNEIQNLVNEYNKIIDEKLKEKAAELMSV